MMAVAHNTFVLVFIACMFAIVLGVPRSSYNQRGSKKRFFLEINSRTCVDYYKKCTERFCELPYRLRDPSQKKYWFKRMKKICKKTCGYCRAPAPPPCFESSHGCCWDYVTPSLGPDGRGCGRCDDNEKYPSVCRRFKFYCLQAGFSGQWMRDNCPHSCGHCQLWSR